jgi:NAD(P)-dependent dehydrogenase (short-subunit alcohol dehydrogenase family)
MATIVMTGGTAGLGRLAARRLLRSPNTRLLLGARSSAPRGAEALALEMTKLDNVRCFASAVGDRLGTTDIDALVLNAGMSPPDGNGRTPDGFEVAFAVNHLAHYLLLRLLLPRLAHGATVVLTTSGTHDPAEGTIVPPPRHADARLLAHPEWNPNRDQTPRAAGGRAYSSSKLCNLLTARALAARPEARTRQFTVIAYDPGPTPGTSLARDSGPAINFVWQVIGPELQPLVPRFNSVAAAGGALADLALGKTRPPAGHIYAALRRGRITWPQPSDVARRNDVMEALRRGSAALVALPT